MAPPRGARSQPHRLRAPAHPLPGLLLEHRDQNRRYSDVLLRQRVFCRCCSRGRNSAWLTAARLRGRAYRRQFLANAGIADSRVASIQVKRDGVALISIQRGAFENELLKSRQHPALLLPSEYADRNNPAQREHKPELKQTSAPIHSDV